MAFIEDYRLNVRRALAVSRAYLKAHGVERPCEAMKTQAYYQRALDRAVVDFYGGEIDEGEFIDEMIRLIEGQFQRAWNEGSRDVKVDPKDHTEEDDQALQSLIDAELENVLQYAEDINNAASDGKDIAPLRQRIDLWTNRYNEIVNDARIHFGGKQYLEWIYGDTEHCSTCASLNGIVATAEEWAESGYHPQGAPNDKLECGGWRCQCSLEPTDKKPTEGGINV